MSGITIATASGGIATKQFRQTSGGLIIIDYPKEKWWLLREEQAATDAQGWAGFLNLRVTATASCCLYGRPVNTTPEWQRRLVHDAADGPASIREVPRDYLVLDLDGVPLPTGQNFLADPGSAIAAVVDKIEDLHGVAFAFSVSCSGGFKPGVRAKVIVLLTEALLPSEMRRWAEAENARGDSRLIDPTVLAPAQPLYFAKPVLHGIVDPFPARAGFRPGQARARLNVPAQTSYQPSAISVRGPSRRWQSHLHHLGPQGFHDVLLAAAGAVVRDHSGAPEEPIASVIHGSVRQAVLSAARGPRSDSEIARYASRRFWDEAIGHAARREQHRFARIAASVAGIRRA